MNAERFAVILDAYGADPRRWPEAERAAATACARDHGRDALARARALDDLMEAHTAPAPSARVRARVLACAPRPPRASPRNVWARAVDWRRVWAPGAGLAAAGVAGAMFGAVLFEGAFDAPTRALLAETEPSGDVLIATLEAETP